MAKCSLVDLHYLIQRSDFTPSIALPERIFSNVDTARAQPPPSTQDNDGFPF